MGTRTRLNSCYHAMLTRCYCENHPEFNIYGGRGIEVCFEWRNKEKVIGTSCITKGFVAFRDWALSHGYTDELTLDRIDNDKGYAPDNCRWVTMTAQVRNRSCARNITYKGETHSIKEWSEILNINYHTLCSRLVLRHWSTERAFMQPIRTQKEKT